MKFCHFCGREISAERLEAIPETVRCIECARKYPEPPRHDPNEVCAQASPSGQNGWSSKS